MHHDVPLRTALRTLVRQALLELMSMDGTPSFATVPDNGGWNRFGQREFGAQRRNAWQMPPAVSHYRWLDMFPAMAEVRSVAATDAVLRKRLERGAGLEFFMPGPQNFGWSVVCHVIEPMVRRSRSYDFDEAAFSAACEAFLRGWQAAQAGSWAVAVEHRHPIILPSQMPEHPAPEPFPTLDEPVEQLVKALRVVCGGSVVETRPMRLQHDDDFPLLAGSTAVLTSLSAVDFTRPTLLTGNDVDEVIRVFARLDDTSIRADRLLGATLDRLVIGGAQGDPAQRLTDLMTCLEMIFIKRAGIADRRQKSIHIQEGIACLLAGDQAVGAPHLVADFVAAAYRKRNDYMHGDDPHDAALLMIGGSHATSLTEMVDAAEFVTRRVVYRTLMDERQSWRGALTAPSR